MKGYKFGSWEDAQQYLSGSIIRVNNHPVYVIQIGNSDDGGLELHYYTLDTMRSDNRHLDRVPLYHDTVDLSPVPLGFMNVKTRARRGSVISVSRMPRRMWKIGLTHRNASLLYMNWEDDIAFLDTQRLVYSRWLCDTIINNFPSLNLAKDNLSRDWEMVAFSRNFAFSREGMLYYKRFHHPVGTVDDKGARLQDDYQYLTQLIELDGLRCL